MPPRVQVDGAGLPTPEVRPAARPRDTYVYSPPGNSGMTELARGLSALAPSLARFGGQIEEAKKIDDSAQGARMAEEITADREAWADFVKKNPGYAHQSPWVLSALYERLGTLYGAQRFAGDLRVAADKDEVLQNSVETADFDNFTKQYTEAWESEHLPEELKANTRFFLAYSSMKDSALEQERNRQSAAMGQRAQGTSAATRTTLLGMQASGMLATGKTLAEVGTFLTDELRRDIQGLGLSGTALNRAMASQLVARAEAELDFRYLDLLKHVTTRDGARLYDVSEVLEAYGTARTSIARGLSAQSEADTTALKIRKERVEQEAFTMLVKQTRDAAAGGLSPMAIRGTVWYNSLVEQAVDVGLYEFAEKSEQYLINATNRRDFSDPETYSRLAYEVRTGNITAPQQLMPHVASLSAGDEDKLFGLIEKYRNNPSLIPTRRNDPAVKQAEAMMGRIANAVFIWNPRENVDVVTLAEAGRERLAMTYFEWLDTDEGKAANAQQKEDYATSLAFRISREVLKEMKALTPRVEKALEDRESFREASDEAASWSDSQLMTTEEFLQLRREFEQGIFTPSTINLLIRAGLESSDLSNVEKLVQAQRLFHAPMWFPPTRPKVEGDSTKTNTSKTPEGADSTKTPNND